MKNLLFTLLITLLALPFTYGQTEREEWKEEFREEMEDFRQEMEDFRQEMQDLMIELEENKTAFQLDSSFLKELSEIDWEKEFEGLEESVHFEAEEFEEQMERVEEEIEKAMEQLESIDWEEFSEKMEKIWEENHFQHRDRDRKRRSKVSEM